MVHLPCILDEFSLFVNKVAMFFACFCGRSLGGHQDFLISDARWGRLRCHERQLEVVGNPVHHGGVGEQGDDANLGAALGKEQRVDFIDFADHLGSAFGGDALLFLLDQAEYQGILGRLPELPSVGIGIELL
jgi:hypothetical protein